MNISRYVLLLGMVFTGVSAHSAESWTSVTKPPDDYTSAGVVTITGAVTLQPGTYTFDTLIVNASRTLTVTSNTTTGTGVIINANTVTVNGTINGDGQGYPGNSGPGVGNSTAVSGGTHGGFGGLYDFGDYGVIYGDPSQPTTLGSGGGMRSKTPGAGGGALKLDVSGALTVAGTITMNGTQDSGSGVSSASGSGGSIWIKAATLTGSGTIRADGADNANLRGTGGGGRVLISYGTNAFTGTATANGGTTSIFAPATKGSLWFVDYVNNDLYINSESSIANGTYTYRNITINSSGMLSNDGHGNKKGLGTGKGKANGDYGTGASHGGRGASSGTVTASATYGNAFEPTDLGSGGIGVDAENNGGSGGGAIKLIATGVLTINGVLTSSGWGPDWNTKYPSGGSGGSIWIVADSVAGSGSIYVNGGAGASTGGSVGGGGRLAIYHANGYSSSLNISVGWFSGGSATGATLGSAVVVNSTTNDLYIPTSSSFPSGTYAFNNVTLAPGAILHVNDGNGPDTGTGKGVASASGGGGGGYGGAGGAGTGGAGGAAYGSATAPVDLGSGGGTCTTSGIPGYGGGAVRFNITNTLTVGAGAVLSANGSTRTGTRCGGGSGGSILIYTKNLNSVANGITAIGGNGDSNGGGGGGGRIAIFCTGSYSGTLSAAGGTGKTAGAPGTATNQCSTSTWLFRGY